MRGDLFKKFIILLICSMFFLLSLPQNLEVLAAGTDVVTFKDQNLEKAVRTQLNKTTGDITVADMETLRTLTASNANIVDLTGLEKAKYLTSLTLDNNKITSIEPLRNLIYLDQLNLFVNQIKSVEPLSSLKYLRSLFLGMNKIEDVTPLQNLTSLGNLDLSYNNISNISALRNLTNLTYLSINFNQIAEIDLSNLSNLTRLIASNNKLTSVNLSGTPRIRGLYLSNNSISSIDLTPIKPQTDGDTKEIFLSNNLLTNIDVKDIKNVSEINLAGNQLTAVDLTGVTTSSYNQVVFNLSNNKLESVTFPNARTTDINVSHNQLKTLKVGSFSSYNNSFSLDAKYNPLTSVDFSGVSLTSYYGGTSVDLSHTNLTSLTMIKFPENGKLGALNLSDNGLQTVDFSGLSATLLSQISQINLNNNEISSLDISGATNLSSLYLTNNKLTSLGDIKGFLSRYIRSLDISNNEISDISDLIMEKQLQVINLAGTKVVDIFPLGLITELREINISNTAVNDLSPLNGLPNLYTVNAENTLISNLSPLSKSVNLSTLNVANTKITTLESLTNKNIYSLNLSNNHLTNLDALLGLGKLSNLNISGNGLADINFLSGLKQQLNTLNLSNNTLNDLSLLADFTNLYSLNISNNQVNNLKFLENHTNLGYINLANNDITDLSSLRKIVENYSTHFDLGMDYPYDFDTRYKKVIDISNNALDLSSVSVDLETLKQLSNLTFLLAKPIVNALDESTEIVTGQAEPNLPVTVKIGTQLYTSTVLGDGRFEVRIPRQTAGTIIKVTVTDRMGNESESTSVEVVDDITPPAAPKVSEVTVVDTVVKGTTEANAGVTISVGTTAIGTGTADESGVFSITIPKQSAGTTMVITVKDTAGNKTSATIVTKNVSSIKVQLNGKDFTNGFFGGGTTYVHWKALDVFKIPYTNDGNGNFVIEGRAVKAENINNEFYIKWSDLSPGRLTFKKITGGYNFIYPTSIKVQVNGTAFTDGFFKEGNAYVQWKVLETLKIPFTFNGKGTFTIEGREVQGESINGSLYIRWNQLSPGKITYKVIDGGYNFIYATPIKVQLNGQAFTDGIYKDGNAYVHWKALETLKIPFTYQGNGSFTIEGRQVQAVNNNGSLYIRWNQLSPGKITYRVIDGGYNFSYPTSIKVQLNGKAFTDGYYKEGATYVHWKALETLKIPFTYQGNGSYNIEGRQVQGENISGSIYIRWDQLSPGKITFKKIDGGYNFIYPTSIIVQLNGNAFTDGFFKEGAAYVHWKALETFKIPFTYDGNGLFTIEGRKVQGDNIAGSLYIRWNELSPAKVTFQKITNGYNFIYNQ